MRQSILGQGKGILSKNKNTQRLRTTRYFLNFLIANDSNFKAIKYKNVLKVDNGDKDIKQDSQ